MALLPWDDDPNKKDQNIFDPPVKQVASVQSGSWQPAPSGADSAVATNDMNDPQQQSGGIFGQQPKQDSTPAPQDENYLVSDQHAQVEQQKRQRDAEIEQARIDAENRKRAADAAAAAKAFEEGQLQNQQGQKLDVNALKNDNGWKKYYDDAFKKERDSLDFWGRLMDGGQASKRAEVMARNRYAHDLINQAYDENGNVIDANAALRAKGVTAYNSALANDNSTRSMALARAIGATKDNQGSGFWNRLKNAINAEKQMSIYDAIFGADDGTKFTINDVGRFGGGLVQGVGTMIPIGAKELEESARGRGTNAQTGFEDNLTAGERVGRAISGGLNVVTPFVGGSGKLLDSLTTKVAQGTATAAERTMLEQMARQIVLPAVEQGGIGAAQAGGEYFGNGNTLLDEHGNLDMNKVKEFAKQTGEAGALGFAGGALMSGGAMGVNRLRARGADIPTLSPDELAQLETANSNVGAAELSQMHVGNEAGSQLSAMENGATVTPVPDQQKQQVADGVAQPVDEMTPVAPEDRAAAEAKADGVATPETAPVETTPAGGEPTLTPVNALTPDMLPEGARTSTADTPNQLVNPDETAPAPLNSDGIATPDVPPAEMTPTDITPVTEKTVPKADVPAPIADGRALNEVAPVRDENLPPVAPGEKVKNLQDSRAGTSQAEEAAINQQLVDTQNTTPHEQQNLPEGLTGDTAVDPETGMKLTRDQVAERLMPKLADNSDVKQRIADAAGMTKDAGLPLDEILKGGNVNPKRAERITKHFNDLEKQLSEYNGLEEQNQKAYAEGGTAALDENVSRQRSRVARDMGTTTRRLMNEIKKLEGSRDMKVALIHGITEAIGTRNANVLTSAGLIERNIFQELTANAKLAVKNPIKMARSTFGNGNIFGDTAKSELSHWKDLPTNPLDALHYVVGNTYRTAMIPTTALANTRRGAVRDELTRWAFQELEGRKVSASEAHRLAGTAGNEMEALVNTFIGVDNGMTNRKQATDALKAWKEYIRTGDDGAKTEFLQKVEHHNSLADQMISGLAKEDQNRAKGLMAIKNLIFPFVRTATNLAKTAVRQDVNPFAKSLLDEIRADQRGGTANAINLVKSKLVDYGIMGGAAALASSGALVYNNGDEVDKPRGWSIKVGDNHYVPVRATSLELPIAMAGTGFQMSKDIAEGKARDWQYYAGMITQSLPYIDQFNQTTGVVDSAMNANNDTSDKGYAAKSYAVNTIKSFVPGSNNGIQPYVAGKENQSLNAKTVYDKNFMTWLGNAIHKNYDPNFYNGLKDSRDMAGRVRTVDNQGVVSNKTINDANTAEFNSRITDLVNYGRENGLGQGTQDMFNTYDTGKNNNFKSIQDTITFLDEPSYGGKGKPDAANKLKKNGKLAGLSQQMRDGFFGDKGDELLQLDGQTLKSDASTPNKAGTKNSKLPISMQSIKNAVAQTDLSADQSDQLYQISNQSTDLYNRLHNKEITYDQYSAAKAKLSQQEINILSNSKNYQKMVSLFDELDQSGFFNPDGLGATKAGQTYLWNSLNALLGSKGATPAAEYPDSSKGFTPWNWNRGTGRSATNKPGDRGNRGVQWTPVKARQMAGVQAGRYTPLSVKVKLGNEVKKNRTQNYSDRTF